VSRRGLEDTDCSFVGYFPRVSKWAWYFPFKCRREEIAKGSLVMRLVRALPGIDIRIVADPAARSDGRPDR
jgi:hypothetical protein